MIGIVNILPFDKKDIDELVTLVNSAYRGESSKKGWTTEADLLDGTRTDVASIQSLVERPGSAILVCRNEQNLIVGCVHLQKENDSMYLGMLTVSPEMQAMGIGKKLLHAGEVHATQMECDAVVMTVIDTRKELIAWYIRHGYIPTGETKPFPANPSFGIPLQPLQFIVFKKKL